MERRDVYQWKKCAYGTTALEMTLKKKGLAYFKNGAFLPNGIDLLFETVLVD